VTDQFTRQIIDVGTFEVIDPLALKVENGRAPHPADAVASAVEYVSVHGARSVIGPALSLKKLRQLIEKSYGIRGARKPPVGVGNSRVTVSSIVAGC
jgi:hypothetical protein